MLVNDTICALATPPGISGIAVVRLSGTDAFMIADKCFRGKISLTQAESHTVHYGIFSSGSEIIDTVLATVFRNPHSYTGEDSVEISSHGNITVARDIVETLIECGARHAEPGEFTKRAFLNKKLDLTQAEAVAELIHSLSTKGARTAAKQLLGGLTNKLKQMKNSLTRVCGLLELELDFSEEDIEFVGKEELRNLLQECKQYCKELAGTFRSSEIIKHGYRIGIVGFPNAGKSSLLNALLGRERALVSEIAGTTRDYLEETIHYKGLSLTFFDTAGLRTKTDDIIELEGMRLAQELLTQCNFLLVLNDIAEGVHHSDPLMAYVQERFKQVPMLLVQNKIDSIAEVPHQEHSLGYQQLYISARENIGVSELLERVYLQALADTEHVSETLINARHAALLQQAATALQAAEESLIAGVSNEFIAIDARAALRILGEITGESWSEEALNAVFSEFCIGK